MSQQWEHLGEMSANIGSTHAQQTGEKKCEIPSSKRVGESAIFLFDVVECA